MPVVTELLAMPGRTVTWATSTATRKSLPLSNQPLPPIRAATGGSGHIVRQKSLAPKPQSAICFFLILFLVACSHTKSAEKAYRGAWASYVSGDLPRAAQLASDGAKRFAQYRSEPTYWKLRFLYAEVLTAQSNRKAAEALLRDPVPRLPVLDQVEVRRLIDLASISPPAAPQTAAMLQRARTMVKDPESSIRLDLAEGVIVYNQGKVADCERLFQDALDMATRTGSLYQQGQALSSLSAAEKALHRYEQSIAFGLRALEVANRVGARRTAAFAHGNVGSTFAWLGDFDAAMDHQRKAIEIFQQIGARADLMIAVGELGLAYDRDQEFSQALANYQRGYALAKDLGRDRDAARLAESVALALIKTEHWDEAEQWNQQAEKLAASSGNRYIGVLVQRNQALIDRGQGRLEEASAICRDLLKAHPDEPFVEWEAYDLLGRIAASSAHYTQADSSFDSALRIISDNRAELVDSRNRITLLSRLMPFYQAYVESLVKQNDDARALRVIESSRARVLSERLGRDVHATRFDGLSDFEHAAVVTHADILTFWLAPARSFAWLITPTRVDRFELPGSVEIENLVTRYREEVEHSLRDPIRTNNVAATALWHDLLEKIAPRIPKDTRLIVVPDGALHRLNLETLIVPEPKPHYWIEDVQMAVSPSITVAASRPASTAAAPAPSLLLIGSPNYAGTSYDALPNAGREISQIESHFDRGRERVYLGAEASPAAYLKANPAQFSLIHFAAHAEANFERPLESAVVLSGSASADKLFAHDVVDVPIRASLVTISACRSAGTRAYNGEGLMGFAWAFLRAGARAVIAGLWDVSDSSTAQLMDRLYAGIAAGSGPAAALRAAKLSLLHGAGDFQKPFYWGPFQIYLGSAER